MPRSQQREELLITVRRPAMGIAGQAAEHLVRLAGGDARRRLAAVIMRNSL
jgi:hypothetical protein